MSECKLKNLVFEEYYRNAHYDGDSFGAKGAVVVLATIISRAGLSDEYSEWKKKKKVWNRRAE